MTGPRWQLTVSSGSSPRLMESDIDPVAILAMLPTELKLLIKTFTSILQMQDAFLTNDLEEMAKLVCNYHHPTSPPPPGEPRAHKKWRIACWVNALVSGLY